MANLVTIKINNQIIINDYTLDQEPSVDSNVGDNTLTTIQRKHHSTVPDGSILEKLFEFASSVADFWRTDKGNIRHKLEDILLLNILARVSKCTRCADIIEFSRYNLARFHAMGMFENGVPSEPTLYRIEKGIDDTDMDDRMKE